MKVLVVEPRRNPYVLEIDGSLTSMQKLVGGMIQAIYPFEEPVALVCNEEGKLLGLPPNRFLCHPDTGLPYDYICGTFFLCSAPPDSEEFCSLSEEQMNEYKRMYIWG